jgi:hypothetical protein
MKKAESVKFVSLQKSELYRSHGWLVFAASLTRMST